MLKEFTLNEGKAIINFSEKFCDTRQKLLNSYGFRRVVEVFIQKLKKDEQIVYNHYITAFKNDEEFGSSLIEVFKWLAVCNADEILNVNNKYKVYFDDKDSFIELIDSLFAFWRRLERFAVVQNRMVSEGLQNVRFTQSNTLFGELVMTTYRRTVETIKGSKQNVYREFIAGANAGLMISDIKWNCPLEYNGLANIPFTTKVIFTPPFITYTKCNKRDGIFHEHANNPIENIVLNEDEWFLFPIWVGSMLTFVYFHTDYMDQGFGLANLFEIAQENDYTGKRPDIIYIFGYPDGYDEKRTFYYKDKKNGMLIGYANHCDEVDYFGYMKKMLLTLHNVKQMDEGCLPIHGAMVNIQLKNGTESNIIIMGDSGAGKSESLEAFRTLNETYIRHMRVIFDDMGFLRKEADGKIKAYGTEIGAFVRIDDLEPAYAYEQLDWGIYSNPDKINARVTIPISTYEVISKGHPVDYFLYANNYTESDEKIHIYDNLDDAIKVFEQGARKAKGTTTETGLVTSYFANPFGPVQERPLAEKLVREYFSEMRKEDVKIGEIYTELAVEGKTHEGPRKAAEELFKIINK